MKKNTNYKTVRLRAKDWQKLKVQAAKRNMSAIDLFGLLTE